MFDPVGRINNLTNPEGQVSSWTYDAASRVTANFLANGTQASYTYDGANHLLLLANLASGGTTLSSFNYTYNSVGNQTQAVEADGDVVTWSYDPAYQLTNEQRSCQSRPGREPFSRAKVGQLSSCGIRIDFGNADARVVAKLDGGLVQGQAAQLCPQVELVSLSSAIKAAEEPLLQFDREAARMETLGGVKWTRAAKVAATARGGMIANQVEHALHRNLVAQSSVIDQHRF